MGRQKMTAQLRATKYADYRYDTDSKLMFCKYCNHSIEWTRKQTCDEHINSERHNNKKKAHTSTSSSATGTSRSTITRGRPVLSYQTSIETAYKSSEARNQFVQDFVVACTVADIPLYKAQKLRPFLKKHCKQGGALSGDDSYRRIHLPKLYEQHVETLKTLVADRAVTVIADETTDCRDRQVLNILVGTGEGKYYLIEVKFMTACNHSTLSQSVTKALTDMNIDFNNVFAFITDSAAYCKKAWHAVLKGLLPNAIHVPCLAHVLNLVGECWANNKQISVVKEFTTWTKSVFFKKPGRKMRYLEYLKKKGVTNPKLPPEPCQSRWNSWFETVIYHEQYLELYCEFFLAEKSSALAMQRLLEILTDDEKFADLKLYMSFIVDTCPKVMFILTKFEDTSSPLAVMVHNMLTDLEVWLEEGKTKQQYGPKSDGVLDDLPLPKKQTSLATFHAIFDSAHQKLTKHTDLHPGKPVFEKLRVFDPRQAQSLPRDIGYYTSTIPELNQNNMGHNDIAQEWLVYQASVRSELLADPFDLVEYWKGSSRRFPNLSKAAMKYIFFPLSSVEVERSFSLYKTLLTDKRERLNEQSTKTLMLLNFNGDICGRFVTQMDTCDMLVE